MRGHPPQLQGDIELIDQQAKISPETNLIPAELASASTLPNEISILATETIAKFDLLLVKEEIQIDALPVLPTEDLADEITGHLPPASDHISGQGNAEASETINLLMASGTLVQVDNGTTLELLALFDNHGTDSTPYGENIINSLPDHHNTSNDLIFLDAFEAAKGGNGKGGGGNGGGGNGGSDDSNVLSKYTSGDDSVPDSDEFNILIDFKGEWTELLQGAFTWAADWISDIIVSDIPDVFFRGKIIDDIKITAELKAIDGEGGILGQAGPTAIRTDGSLTALGTMQFDSADASYYESIDLWDSIVIHEMLHTVGFGTIWDNLGLINGLGTTTPTFNGTEAMLAYGDLLDSGSGDSVLVPLEYGEGPGTDYSHWDDDLFGNEIMTGYISASNDMTALTVASLDDLGYDTVDWETFVEFTV